MNFVVLVLFCIATTIAAPISVETYDTRSLPANQLGQISSMIITMAGYAFVLKIALKVSLIGCPFDVNYCLFSHTNLGQSTAKMNTLTDINLEKLIAAYSDLLNPHLSNIRKQANDGKTLLTFPPAFTMVKHVMNPVDQIRLFPIAFKNSYVNLPIVVSRNEKSDAGDLDINSFTLYLKRLPQFDELSFRDNVGRQVKQLEPHFIVPGMAPA